MGREMKKTIISATKYILLFAAVIAIGLMSGCDRRSSYSLGCEAYERGEYYAAEGHFLDALANGEPRSVYYIAYAYTLAASNDYEGCMGVVNTLLEENEAGLLMTDDEKKESCYLLAYSAEKLGKYEEAVEYYQEMKYLETDAAVQQNIDSVIFLCYQRIFEELMQEENKEGLAEYYNKITSYASLHTELMSSDAYASLAGMSLYMYDLEDDADSGDTDFLGLAEEYIATARRFPEPDSRQLERYEIIIAERRGKADVAYKLLEVYASHFPDDESVLLEQEFLKDRLRGE